MNVTVIEDSGALDALCERLAGAGRIALDTEFHNERSYAARLMVVQLAFADEIALIDPLHVAELQPLATALASKVVVGHALQSDLKIFADRFGTLPATAFDTQLAAAFCGYGMAISLGDLVNDVTGTRLRKSHTVSDWSSRPLTAGQIEYLVDDVRYLFVLQDRLTERLQAAGRYEWFQADARALTDLDRYRPDAERLYLRIPGAMRMNRRELGILRELAQLRDRLARERDVPLKYIMPDDVMAPIVGMRPVQRDDLAQLRRLDAGVRKAFGDRIVAAVAAGMALEESELPRKPARHAGGDRDAIVTCLSVLVNAIAAENELPPPLLVTRSALERIARESPATAEDVARALEATAWRAHLVAEPLFALLCGEIALTVAGMRDGRARVARVTTGAEDDGPGGAPGP